MYKMFNCVYYHYYIQLTANGTSLVCGPPALKVVEADNRHGTEQY